MTALGGSWRHRGRSRGASGGLLALSWGRLEPWDLILEPFFFPEALCFRVLCHRSRNRHRLLVFSFGNSRSTWALALVSRAWACALESCALARGSWALAWALALGSWALTLGFRLWGLRLFSSGASALRSWALVSGFSSGAFGCIFSSWALALVSWAWALALESWAFARGSWALAWGSWSSGVLACDSGVLGCIFSSGASSAVLGFSSGVLGFSSGAFGCIFSSWALALGSWALALGSRAIFLAQGLFLSPCSLNRSGALVALRSWALAVRSWPLGLGALALVQRHRNRFLALEPLDQGSGALALVSWAWA